jgi:hypothetical protein
MPHLQVVRSGVAGRRPAIVQTVAMARSSIMSSSRMADSKR